MTTIITRLFPDTAAAEKAVRRLRMKGVPPRACIVITAGDRATARMERARVHESAIGRYNEGLAAGQALLVVQATYKPLGVVRMTRELLAKYDTIDAGGVTEEHELPWEPVRAGSILPDHPLLLTLPDIKFEGRVSSRFGMRLLKEHKHHRPLIDRRMSRAFWPMPLLSTKRRKASVYHGGRFMSKMFWPGPLLSHKPRQKSVIPGGGFPFSRVFGMRTVS